jgi:5,10-methylenetetrahydromethanopterin reductase
MVELGIQLFPPIAPIRTMVALARRADALGFSTAWVADEGFGQDPYVALTAIAAETSAIRLGTGITNPYSRHPAVTAVAIASLDAYAGGRAFLGLGAGGVLALTAMDLRRHHLITRCRETIAVCRALWRNETVTFEGRTFRLTNARLHLTTRPIEIWIGARGPKMLRLAGELADGVLINGIPHFDLDRVVGHVREGAAPAGRRLRLAYGVYLIPDRTMLETIRPYFTFRLVDSPPEVRRRLGVSDDLVATMRAEIASHGLQTPARRVPDEILEQFVFIGDRPAITRRLGEIAARHGIDQLALFLPRLEGAESAMADAAEIVRHL